MGLLDIDKAELLYAEKVNNVYAPKYYEFNRYYDSGTNYACYKTITDMETETGEYFGNGTNFSLVLMIREASGWKIGGICKCPRDLGSVPAGVTVSRQSYGFVSYQSQPDYIKVKDEKGAVKNVAFSTYLKNVTYNEIGNMGYYDEAIKANVMAIKMCGWWAHAAGYRSAEGCDIKYGDVAYKSSYQTKPAITNAINAVDGKKLVSSGGQLFLRLTLQEVLIRMVKILGDCVRMARIILQVQSRIHIQRFFIITMIIHPTIIRPLALSKSINR